MGWRWGNGDYGGSFVAGPLILTLLPPDPAEGDETWFWQVRVAEEFWDCLGNGEFPGDLSRDEAKRAALLSVLEVLEGIRGSVSAALGGDGKQAGRACFKAGGNCNGC
jgi:hypothetical protein